MKYQSMTNLLGAAAAIGLLSGCANFYKAQITPSDEMVDQSNMVYVRQVQKDYELRQKFSRPVEIRPSDAMQMFLTSSNYMLCRSSVALEMKQRYLIELMKNALVTEVGKLRDFRLVNMESRNLSVPGMATTTDLDVYQQNRPYLITFQIITMRLINTTRDAKILAGAIVQISDRDAGRAYRRATAGTELLDIWAATAQVEVALTAPDGKRIFTYTGSGIWVSPVPSVFPAEGLMDRAVHNAAVNAMNQYARQFGPPMYVKETRGNGLFVRISAGSAYGIKEGTKIEFYRNRVRQMPALPGEQPRTETIHEHLGFGYAGYRNAPIEQNEAWVFVPDNDDPETRKIYTWASARVAQ